jgi:anaerobic magnesium-protoporphyrin IX monomethyl ester cyclase
VAAAVQERWQDVQVLDAALMTCELPAILSAVRAASPDAVLLCHSDYNRKHAPEAIARIAQGLRDALPEVPLALYGRLDARHAEAALADAPALDVCLFGEPDVTVPAWLSALPVHGSVGSRELQAALEVPGSVRRDGGFTTLPAVPPDLSESPTPAWALVPLANYGFSPHQQAADLVFPVLASRGCPYPCFYCEVRARPRYIARSVESVVQEIETIRARHGVRSVFMADPTFAVDREWALEFCRQLEEKEWDDLRWSCMSRTDRVDDELLQSMAKAGCWNILFGIESLNPEALNGAEKALDPATVAPALAAAKRAGIETIASVMIGLPGDTPAGVQSTVDQIIAMEPDFAQFFVLQIDADEAPDGGRFLSDWTGDKHDFWGRVYAPEAFDDVEQLETLRRQAFRRFYLRPRYIRRRLAALVRSEEPVAQLARVARGGLLALRMAAGQRIG